MLQANKKDCEAFDDDDVDLSSGSDFDEDEDPDQIGVPGKCSDAAAQSNEHYWFAASADLFNIFSRFTGGGKDLETAVVYAKNSTLSKGPSLVPNVLPNESILKHSVNKPLNNFNSTVHTPPLKGIIPAESMLKPFLPKVNTASTRIPATATAANTNNSMTTQYAAGIANKAAQGGAQGTNFYVECACHVSAVS